MGLFFGKVQGDLKSTGMREGFTSSPMTIKNKLNTQFVRGFTPPFAEVQCFQRRAGFTLFEVIIVLVIIGILASLGTVNYGPYKERTLDREAQANLKLILAAERIYRLETGLFYASVITQTAAITNINNDLRLLLSSAANRSWDYITTATGATACCAKATRITDSRTWRMRNTEDNPRNDAGNNNCP